MMAGQTIETVITVDANQAIAELAKFDQETKAAEKALRDADAATKAFEKAQREAVAAVTAIDTKIEKYERDMMALGTAILAGKGNTAAYEAELRQLGRELDALNGKTPVAVKRTNDFAHAVADVRTQGKGSGLAVLEFSRAFEDLQYGIGGVLNNIPNLLMNLGIGAGLTGVVSVAAVGIHTLAKNFGAIDPAAKDAVNSAKEHVKSLRDQISGLSRDLRALQVGAERAEMEQQAKALLEAQRQFERAVEPIGGAERFRRLRDNEKLVGSIADQMNVAKEAASRLDLEIQKMAEMRRIQQEKEDQKRIDQAVDAANAITEAEAKGGKQRIDNAKKEADAKFAIFVASMEEEERQLKEVAKMRREAAAEREKLELERMGMSLSGGFVSNEIRGAGAGTQGASATTEMQAMAVEAAINAQMAEDWSLAWIKAGRDVADSFGDWGAIATGTLSTVTAGTQEYLDSWITGQEKAGEAFAVMLMRTAGQSLISSGIELGGKAVVSAFTPGLQPLAAAQGAAAAGLIASGVALGGVATGVEHTAAGGQLFKPLPDKESAKDKGASPRSSRGGGDGGPLVINISYGVGGPLPEDTAREIARTMRTGNRRSGA